MMPLHPGCRSAHMTRVSDVMHAGGMNAAVGLPVPDLARMRRTRLDRLQTEMRRQDVELAVLLHAPHVTYVTAYVPDAIDASHVNYLRPVAIVPAHGPARLHAHTTVHTADDHLEDRRNRVLAGHMSSVPGLAGSSPLRRSI